MSGLKSRDKGRRGEYTVITYMRERGLTATRIPMSGASESEKGDVKIEIPGTRYGQRPMDAKFLYGEVKCRAKDFSTTYALFDQLRGKERHAGIQVGEQLILMTRDFSDLGFLDLGAALEFRPNTTKTAAKIARMQALLKGSDFLVIKGDYQPLVFLRYF